MKKFFILITLFITVTLFGQEKGNDIYKLYYGVEYTEIKQLNVDDLIFYANIEDSLMTIFNPITKKSVVYPFGQIPKKYFFRCKGFDVENEPCFGLCYMIGCINNGNYGFIDHKGNILEPFVWDMKEYILQGDTFDYGEIIDRKTDEQLYCIEYRNNKRRITYSKYGY